MTISTPIGAHGLVALGFGALALALAGPCMSAAHAQDDLLTYQEILQVLPGAWELGPAESDEHARQYQNCAESPTVIRIGSEDGLMRYESQSGYAPDAHVSRSAIRAIPNAILLQYEDEERVTPDGELVQWLLFMPDRDHFYWMRTDWLENGGRTAMRRRCTEAPVS